MERGLHIYLGSTFLGFRVRVLWDLGWGLPAFGVRVPHTFVVPHIFSVGVPHTFGVGSPGIWGWGPPCIWGGVRRDLGLGSPIHLVLGSPRIWGCGPSYI